MGSTWKDRAIVKIDLSAKNIIFLSYHQYILLSISKPILRTKFFKSRLTHDYVKRDKLAPRFKLLDETPFLLVSAPAGYGKSTAVAGFLDEIKSDCAWLSLNQRDDNLKQFVSYFIWAIQSKQSEFGNDVLDLLDAPDPPGATTLAELLSQQLVVMQTPFYMALDDLHLIKNEEVNQFLGVLIEQPNFNFRLIIITRRDPNLPLSVWRNKNLMIEIRAEHLRFNRDEIGIFFSRANGLELNSDMIKQAETITEGWVSGIRMLCLSSSTEAELTMTLSRFRNQSAASINQLIHEILLNYSKWTQDCLLRLSLVEAFDEKLFQELVRDLDEEHNKTDFSEFIQSILESNLFIIPLDQKFAWYRFHHLFAEQLNLIINKEYQKPLLNQLLCRCAQWYLINHQYSAAIEYYLKADQLQKALEVFADYRYQLVSLGDFSELERALHLFEPDVIENHGLLGIAQAWVWLFQGDIPRMANFLVSVETNLMREGHATEVLDICLGEVQAMRAYDRFLSDVDIPKCFEHSKQAINLLGDHNSYALGLAWIFVGGSIHILEGATKAKSTIYDKLQYTQDTIVKAQLLLVLCYIGWFDADPNYMEKQAEYLIDLGDQKKHSISQAHGNVIRGLSLFYQNKQHEALRFLEQGFALRPFGLPPLIYPAAIALSHIYQERNELQKKDEVIRFLQHQAINRFGKKYIQVVDSLIADFSWEMGNYPAALKWAVENDYKDYLPVIDLYYPELIQLKILVLDGSSNSLALAQQIINELMQFAEDRNYYNLKIQLIPCQALVYLKSGNETKAYTTLIQAIELSAIGGFIQSFKGLGAFYERNA